MIHQAFEHSMQIFIVVFAFQTDNGARHIEAMDYAFTDEERCETFAKEVMWDHHKLIGGLYWFCEELGVNP